MGVMIFMNCITQVDQNLNTWVLNSLWQETYLFIYMERKLVPSTTQTQASSSSAHPNNNTAHILSRLVHTERLQLQA